MISKFVLIGDPVAHSLSPIMHNTLYRELAKEKWPFELWEYEAIRCPDEDSASYQIDLVRTGKYRGMNITMPWKKLAASSADFADQAVVAAGGANVLVRDENFKLCAYNTDGVGAVGAIERVAQVPIQDKRVVICGTGPTSLAIATASAERGAKHVALLSRDEAKALGCVNRMRTVLDPAQASVLHGLDYAHASGEVGAADIIVDATPRGMNPNDEPIVDTGLLHEGQIVLDTVYAHGLTALLEKAASQGAFIMDGLEMLVEQAALSVEIWADAMALPVEANRSIMRHAAERS